MSIFTRIVIWLKVDKIINAINKYKNDNCKRKDIEQIREKRNIANMAKVLGEDDVAKHFEKEAKIIEDTTRR